jgi:hypothetical protein
LNVLAVPSKQGKSEALISSLKSGPLGLGLFLCAAVAPGRPGGPGGPSGPDGPGAPRGPGGPGPPDGPVGPGQPCCPRGPLGLLGRWLVSRSSLFESLPLGFEGVEGRSTARSRLGDGLEVDCQGG